MLQVQHEARDARAGFESGEDELVQRDDDEARQRDAKRLVVKQRDAGQRHREQRELDRCTEYDGRNRENSREHKETALSGQNPHHWVWHRRMIP